jgi:eukaryotic-like serine/threonine-protein kinase
MHTNQLHRYLLSFVACSLLLVGVACGPSTPQTPVRTPGGGATATPVQTPGGSATATPGTTSGSTPVSGKQGTPSSGGTSTVNMPQTQTSCPQSGSGRATVMRPLALGSHPNIAYIFNDGTSDTPNFGELKRYDVTTGSKTLIVHLPKTNIAEAQVSRDGQWLLFVSNMIEAYPENGAAELQMVRMDGQGLQTLLCRQFRSMRGVQWSPDQKLVVFSILEVPGGEPWVYLLNLASGVVQRELSSTDTGYGYLARTWPDNTRVYVVGVPVNSQSPQESLYILDTKKGPEQHQQDLLQVIAPTQPQYCWDFDSDYETTRLVTSSCTVSFPAGSTGRGIQQGPSSITVQSITGGSAHTTFTTPMLAIAQVRFLGYKSSRLLLIMENQNYGASVSVDTSQNGLWEMNTDGSGLTRLTTEGANTTSNLNRFTQYPWSNLSFDGSLYALQVTDMQSKDPITTLLYGSLSGGSTTSFAFAHANSGTVEVAGWTMM